MTRVRHSLLAALLCLACGVPAPQAPAPAPHQVRIDTDEAEAALAILRARRSSAGVPESAWSALTSSAGYRRLAEREAAMGRAFTDQDFRNFLLSDTLAAREAELAATLESWRGVQLDAAAYRALDYLPPGSGLRATLYITVKPRTNSFVWDLSGDPAIFMYLEPTLSRAELENTLAHELHHIGYAAACPDPDSTLPVPLATAVRWLGAFGEGVAMLAAAGGPEVHPHAASPDSTRRRWDRDVLRFDEDRARLEEFFLDVLTGRVTDQDSIRARAFQFYGIQGPWYTVGWQMAETVERRFGRDRLVASLCDPRDLIATFNQAAPPGRQWSPELLRLLER